MIRQLKGGTEGEGKWKARVDSGWETETEREIIEGEDSKMIIWENLGRAIELSMTERGGD